VKKEFYFQHELLIRRFSIKMGNCPFNLTKADSTLKRAKQIFCLALSIIMNDLKVELFNPSLLSIRLTGLKRNTFGETDRHTLLAL
jgi:hypothetical protein